MRGTEFHDDPYTRRSSVTTAGLEKMNKRSSEEIARRRHRREKSTIDHLADKVYAPKPAAKDLKEPTTERGLPIEEQVRKKWDPKKGGLPVF